MKLTADGISIVTLDVCGPEESRFDPIIGANAWNLEPRGRRTTLPDVKAVG
jgi:hypothetical protein